jgi:predicted HicB family RNase H-like nuclease
MIQTNGEVSNLGDVRGNPEVTIMSVLRYKDYLGSVCFEDDHLVIQILHIDDFITTECDRASEAQSAFEELVDDYIATCAELNKTPSKPFKGTFNVRIPPALHKQAALAASERGESLNALIAQALRVYLDTTGMGDVESQTAKARYLLALASSPIPSFSRSERERAHYRPTHHFFWHDESAHFFSSWIDAFRPAEQRTEQPADRPKAHSLWVAKQRVGEAH